MVFLDFVNLRRLTLPMLICVLFLFRMMTGRMFVVGTLFGPMCHGWYKFLDSVLPSNHTKTVMKKVFVDQAVASPVFITYFFYGKR